MDVMVAGSGSSGNAYFVSDGDGRLLLDCGLPFRAIQKASGFTLSSLDGCLVTHEHGDHAKSVGELMRYGVDVYMSPGTAAALGDGAIGPCRHRCHLVTEQFKAGPFTVKPLHVEHDAAEPLAFLFARSNDSDRMLYVTDTPRIPYDVEGVTDLMVEANYSYNRMSATDFSLNERIMRTHMSIDALEEWMARTSCADTLERVWLLHLSDTRSSEDEFRRRIEVMTDAEVRVA